MSDVDVLIVGGGITGLAAAHRLRQAAPGLRTLVLEAAPAFGGKIATRAHADFLLEAGPDCFIARKPRGIGLCRELGLEGQLVGRDPAFDRTFVRRGGRLHRLPAGLSGIVPADLEALENSTLLSEEGRARLREEPTIPPGAPDVDESLGDFITRRLGREAFENLVEPLLGGIYAGQADRLSLQSTFPQLKRLEMEHGSVLVGLGAASTPDSTWPTFVSLRHGMRTMIDALVEAIGAEHLRPAARVDAVVAEGEGYCVTWRPTGPAHTTNSAHPTHPMHPTHSTGPAHPAPDAGRCRATVVLFTTPAFASAAVLRGLDDGLGTLLEGIPYASTALVTLAFDERDVTHPLDGYGYVVPCVEGDDVLACTWTSRKWPGRAPDSVHLLRVYMGRYGRRDITLLDDSELSAMARGEVLATLGIDAAPMLERIDRWPRGIPQFNVGHAERVAGIRERVGAWPGLLMAGAAFGGVGIPDCIASGEDAARRAIEFLTIPERRKGS